jgi:hypothetical protein
MKVRRFSLLLVESLQVGCALLLKVVELHRRATWPT